MFFLMDGILDANLEVESDAISSLSTQINDVHEMEDESLTITCLQNDDDEDCEREVTDSGSRLLSMNADRPTMPSSQDGVIGLFFHNPDDSDLSSHQKLSVPGTLSDGSVICADICSQAIQLVTLADGTPAYLQQVKDCKMLEGHVVTLHDGSTAMIQASVVPKGDAGLAVEEKALLNTDSQLEDSGSYLQNDTKFPEGLHAVQLEDGTTALLDPSQAQALLGEGASLMEATSQHFLSAQFNTLSNKQQLSVVENALAIGQKAFRCSYEDCDRLYTTFHHLKVHERSHTGDRPFRCEYGSCGKAFATGYGLKSHNRVHTGEKPYQCPHQACDKAFKTSGDLQKHVRTHTGERPFKCPFVGCERSFTTSNIRKVHIRTHTGERPYLCTAENCGRSFASATNYKNHVRIHTGEKPYVCAVQGCGKRFTEYSSLYKHHVVHTHTKPYTCNYCGKTYRQTSTLAMHKRTAHGEGEDSTVGTETVSVNDSKLGCEQPSSKKPKLRLSLPNVDVASPSLDEESEALVMSSLPMETTANLLKLDDDDDVEVLTPGSSDGNVSGFVNLPLHTLSGFAMDAEPGQSVLVVTNQCHLEIVQQLSKQQRVASANTYS